MNSESLGRNLSGEYCSEASCPFDESELQLVNKAQTRESRMSRFIVESTGYCVIVKVEADNVNVHRAAAKIIVSKSRAARGSVCNVLLSDEPVRCELRALSFETHP